jgi:hypothetical protein
VNRPWTDDEIEQLTHMRCTLGLSALEIAHRLGNRTPDAVSARCEKLRLRLPNGMRRGHTPSRATPVPVRQRWPHQADLQAAWQTGAPIKTTARALCLSEETVRCAYEWFGYKYAADAPDYVPDGYMGAREMVRLVAPHYRVTPRMVFGVTRYAPAVRARAAVARVLRERGVALGTVARLIGRKDHSTVINLLQRHPPDKGYKMIKDAVG